MQAFPDAPREESEDAYTKVLASNTMPVSPVLKNKNKGISKRSRNGSPATQSKNRSPNKSIDTVALSSIKHTTQPRNS